VQQQRETVRDNRKRFFRINVRKVFYIPYGGWQEIAACYKKVHKLLQNGYNSGLTKRKVLIIKEKIKLLGNRSAPAPATNFKYFEIILLLHYLYINIPTSDHYLKVIWYIFYTSNNSLKPHGYALGLFCAYCL
jgi:hypothetical protein